MPTTEAMAGLGNMSETVVNRFEENPWCADAASPTKKTATHMFDTCVANITGNTHNAHTSIANFRAALTVHPRPSSHDDSQPPPTLPTSAMR